jgi:hypothetical protein
VNLANIIPLRHVLLALLAIALVVPPASAAESKWVNGFPDRPDFFPLCVWVQAPRNAAKYKAIGINTYVALWGGPTDEQLAALDKQGMYAVVQQTAKGLEHKNSHVIVGWMHEDEPDNAQKRTDGQPGWGPPIAPEKIVADYEKMKAADPTRPVLLNLGQGVAWDNWRGRGVRSRHPEDYPQYVKGCDIASFDIYPVTHDNPEVAGKLEYVGNGTRRLREWAGGKPVWACIETTRISNPKARPTPEQVRSEVWMAIAGGATGIIYFCHEFKPQTIEPGLLQYPEIVEAVKKVNAEVIQYAPALNSPTVTDAVQAKGDVAALVKRQGQDLYVFTVSQSAKPARASFTLQDAAGGGAVEVLGEGRNLTPAGGRFEDDFAPYAVHLYKIHK